MIQSEVQLPLEFGVNAQAPLPENGKGAQDLIVKNGSKPLKKLIHLIVSLNNS